MGSFSNVNDDEAEWIGMKHIKVNELERLQKLNENQAKQILSLENIKDNPKIMNFWKGLPKYEKFYALYHF